MLIAVVDCETNGTESWRHSLWEFGAVLVSADDPSRDPEPLHFAIPADVEHASPDALRVNRYFERKLLPDDSRECAQMVAARLAGASFASCNVGFDTAFVTRFLRDNGAVPTWHYSPIDIKSLCYGRRRSLLGASTSQLLKAFGVDVEQCLAYFDCRRSDNEKYGRHSALADAYLAAALLYEVMGWGTLYGSRCDARWGSYRCQRPFGHEQLAGEGAELHSNSLFRHAGETTWTTDHDGRWVDGSLRGTGVPSFPLREA
jgi:hypothetical protein